MKNHYCLGFRLSHYSNKFSAEYGNVFADNDFTEYYVYLPKFQYTLTLTCKHTITEPHIQNIYQKNQKNYIIIL